LKKSKFRYEGGDEVEVKWNKNMETIDFVSSKRDKISVKL